MYRTLEQKMNNNEKNENDKLLGFLQSVWRHLTKNNVKKNKYKGV